MHEVPINRLGGLSLPRKSVVRLTDRPDMTLDVDRGRKTTIQHIPCVPDHAIASSFMRLHTQKYTAKGQINHLAVFEHNTY